ncbi:T-complex protein 11-domain-containing protein [Gamsiella multidivaricata]|uniref:T-complex protein 11-domain-containing protein n=1 Tax=Gamsiella multidivaricata TaxID=101098 RepID=UPI00221FFEF5|nr:T-complex protein 11-domain-containing protein [Gamsiella multidivaricata]KAI7817582.1 T-complex protein 11-domain-containing protein [Gamsiella multidivaricata]
MNTADTFPTSQPAAAADRPTGLSADPAFESLVESSKALLEALQTWLSANLHPNKSSHQDEPSSSPNPTQGIPKDQHQQRHAELLRDFDRAWTSYYNFFEAWKDKDAKRLLQTLLDHAQQIESLWRTVQGDSSARLEWEPRIEEQRRDLRAKAGQLAGPEGAARLDAVFANFVNTTAPDTASNALSSNNNPDSIESISAAPPSTTSSTGANHVVKKRQRVVSVSSSDSEIASTEHVSTSNDIQTLPEPAPAESTSMANKNKSAADQKPKAKKPAVSKPAATGSNAAAKEETSSGSQDILSAVPVGLKKPSKWTNLQLIHELALDTEFKIEPRRPLDAPGSSSSSGQGKDKNTADAPQVSQSLEAQVRAMATKAYFDKIREDAQQGNLGKWIPSLLTTIREQLLDMIPAESAMAVQVSESFDLEFVQQQVDRKVYDIKGALESVLTLMSRLCAPVRDPKVRQIQQDLSQTVIQNPFEQSSVDTSTAASAYSAASASLRDLVSVLQDILELLEVMMLDMANFRLTVARPRLEKQAIPYEQEAFRKSLDKDEVSLDSTRAWLQDTVVNHPQPASTSLVSTSSTFLSPSPSSSSTPSAISSVEGGEHGEGASSAQSHRTNNRYYEVLVQGMLDLIFSKRHFDREDRDYLPATLALDRERLMRYQNEVQGLALVAVMLNVSLNVAPTLKDQEQHELKETLLKLIENPSTSQEQLTEAIIEAKEKALLLAARGRSISPSASASASASHFSTTATTSAAQLLLSEDQKKYIRHTLVRAISFESTLYTVLSQRVRQTIGYFMLTTIPISTTNAAGERRAGAMLDRADLNKMGLGSLASELEALAVQIRFLTKYNAQVYKQWYDPMLTTILSSSVASSAATTISTSINATTETTTGSQQP